MKPSHSNLARVASNYIRLISTLVIGLLVVRLILRFGNDAFALTALLGTGTGIALMLKQVVRTSTVPILGEAYHSDEPTWFEQVLNSALLCSFLAGLATFAFFVVFAFCLPLLNFPQELYWAALVFVLASGFHSFVNVALSPFTNFYIVSERMVAHNILLFLERLGDIVAIGLALLFFDKSEVSNAIMFYGICTACFYVLINLAASILIARTDTRLVPNRTLISRRAISAFLKSVGWNTCVIFAINLHARLDMVIMNLYFGLFGSFVFGLANQAVGYLRQTIFGLISGMDAVAARVAKTSGDSAVLGLMNRSTKLQALIVFPVSVAMAVLGEPMIRLWLSGRLEEPEKAIPMIVWLMRILLVGVAARCLSEGWMSVMNGAGKVKNYAVVVLIGGVLNPILSVIAVSLTPEPYRFAAVAMVFSGLLVLVHVIGIPWSVARSYNARVYSIIGPLIRPGLIAIAACGAGNLASRIFDDGFGGLLLFIATFGVSFSIASYCLAFDESEKAMVSKMLSRIISRRSSRPST